MLGIFCRCPFFCLRRRLSNGCNLSSPEVMPNLRRYLAKRIRRRRPLRQHSYKMLAYFRLIIIIPTTKRFKAILSEKFRHLALPQSLHFERATCSLPQETTATMRRTPFHLAWPRPKSSCHSKENRTVGKSKINIL